MAATISEAGWVRQVLTGIGAPTDANNIGNVERWMTAEEPASDWYDRNNPLNTSWGNPGSSGLNSYPTIEAGAQATIDTLNGTNMAGIKTALVSDAPTAAFAAAVEASDWAGSHYASDPIAQIPVPTASPSAPLSGPAPTTSSSSSSSGSASLTGITSIFDPSSWIRALSEVGLVVAGLGLVAAGLFKATNPGRSITSTAGDVAGRAATLAAA